MLFPQLLLDILHAALLIIAMIAQVISLVGWPNLVKFFFFFFFRSWADMNSYSVKMNSHIFTAFLQATTTVTLAPEQVEAVFGAMANYRACEPATAFVYTALLTFCAKQAPDRALDVWHAMQEVQPSLP